MIGYYKGKYTFDEVKKKALEKRKLYYHHYLYKAIPSRFLTGKILEIGAGEGITQMCSKHAKKFFSKDYLGIDFLDFETCLNIIKIDIFDFDFSYAEYDTLLAVAIMEHIDFYKWEGLFQTLKENLNEKGFIIIIVPFKERVETFHSLCLSTAKKRMEKYGKYEGHRVFYITRKIFKNMLGKPVYTKRVRQIVHFREKGETLIWAILRFIKRLITFHPYVWDHLAGKNGCLLFIYQKRKWKNENKMERTNY